MSGYIVEGPGFLSINDDGEEGWLCGAFHPEKNWRCTLPANHEGDHSACIQSIEWSRKGDPQT